MSLPTIQTVSSCPKNEAELSRAIQRKHCEHLAILQRCTPPENFKYHCVLNTWKNETVEVCAQVISSQGLLRCTNKICFFLIVCDHVLLFR